MLFIINRAKAFDWRRTSRRWEKKPALYLNWVRLSHFCTLEQQLMIYKLFLCSPKVPYEFTAPVPLKEWQSIALIEQLVWCPYYWNTSLFIFTTASWKQVDLIRQYFFSDSSQFFKTVHSLHFLFLFVQLFRFYRLQVRQISLRWSCWFRASPSYRERGREV